MKRLLIITSLAVISSVLSFAQTYFTDGLTWETEYISTSTPQGLYSICEYSLEEDMNDSHIYLVYGSTGSSGKEFITKIKVENDLIFFWDSLESEWFLLYNFGLKVGETCTVYRPLRQQSSRHTETIIKCVGESIFSNEYCQLPCMLLEEYHDDSGEIPSSEGIWIKGLGCIRGILENNGFDLDGGGSQLLSASYGYEVIFRANSFANIDNITVKSKTIKINGKNIEISYYDGNNIISIYTVDGMLLKSLNLEDNDIELTINHTGIYIMVIGESKLILSI